MVRAALVLMTSGGPRAMPLPVAGAGLGRGADAGIKLEGDTISRLHAVVRLDNDRYMLENLSTTNVTRLNDVAIERPVPLADGDRLGLGSASLTFHDLASGDRLSGPLCSHCSRENRLDDRDCWYCGTSLINAPTNLLPPRQIACRIITAAGDVHDLTSGERFALQPGGGGLVGRPGESDAPSPLVEIDGDQARIPVNPSPALTLNGADAEAGRPLVTGDIVGTADAEFVIIARAGS